MRRSGCGRGGLSEVFISNMFLVRCVHKWLFSLLMRKEAQKVVSRQAVSHWVHEYNLLVILELEWCKQNEWRCGSRDEALMNGLMDKWMLMLPRSEDMSCEGSLHQLQLKMQSHRSSHWAHIVMWLRPTQLGRHVGWTGCNQITKIKH